MFQRLKRVLGPKNPLRLGYHAAKALAAALWERFPARPILVIGITGSDGKTTVVSMTTHILEHAGLRVGALSTAFFRIAYATHWNETQKTSPSPFVTQHFLRKALDAGCSHVVLEYSSHGLVQHRTAWTYPKIAAITNISPEHLDYHGDMDQYITDKGKLFRMLKGKGTKILRRSDQTYDAYRRIASAETIVYDDSSASAPDLWLEAAVAAPSESSAVVCTESERYDLVLPIPGLFNLENALCAIACAKAAGVDYQTSVAALASFTGAPGRFERIDGGQPFTVIVDFTVTPNAYQKTLEAARAVARDKRVLVLTGSCGDRMREKRSEIGRICSKLADVVVVTNEDPYTEDPERIIDEVWSGVDQDKTDAHRITDRREAITFLLQKADPGDVALFCGKGADTTMWTARGQIPWDERAIVREELAELRQ